MSKSLIIAPSWVGDCIFMGSLVSELHKQNPLEHIDILTKPSYCAMLSRLSYVQGCIPVNFPSGKLNWQLRKKAGQALANQYDKAYILPNSWKSALLPAWAKIPQRIGWLGEARYGLLTDYKKRGQLKSPRTVDSYVALAHDDIMQFQSDLVINPTLYSDTQTQQQVANKYQLNREPPILALCPGSGAGTIKCWPAERFAKLALQQYKKGWAIWLLGGPGDVEIIDFIMKETQGCCVNLSSQVPLEDKIDLLAMATQVVANDSGLMHMAAAVGTPVIGLYGVTNPAIAPPLCTNHKIVSCYKPGYTPKTAPKDTMNNIFITDVLSLIKPH